MEVPQPEEDTEGEILEDPVTVCVALLELKYDRVEAKLAVANSEEDTEDVEEVETQALALLYNETEDRPVLVNA